MKLMLKYTFSLLVLLLSISSIAQDKKTDSIKPIPQRYGIRFGADISKLIRSGFDKNYKGLEFVVDYRLTKKIYIAGEIGNENKITDDTRINFTTKGSYFKVGFDSNSYQNWLDMENMIHVGLRYGVSTFSQELNTYKIYDTAQKTTIALDELIARTKAADVLFFGEEHNDSIGHYLEKTIFQKLFESNGNKQALSLEMFESDVQPVLNEYLQSFIREKNFVKDARAWSNYKDYRPMVEFAKANKLTVIAANAPARYTSMVTRGGLSSLNGLDKWAKSFLSPLPLDTATGRYYDKFLLTMGGHAAMGGMQIYQSQNLWDATMAHHIASYLKSNKGYKVFQVNGRFHSDEKLGAAAQLKKYVPKLTVMNISSFSSDSFSSPDWAKFAGLGDFIIITNPEVRKSY